MGLFNPGTGTGGDRAKAQRLEMVIGILGFFAFMALVQAVVLEIRGDDAVGAAVTLAAILALLYYAVRRRRALKL
jgi:uncharacterized protein (TIGR03382 family)